MLWKINSETQVNKGKNRVFSIEKIVIFYLVVVKIINNVKENKLSDSINKKNTDF